MSKNKNKSSKKVEKKKSITPKKKTQEEKVKEEIIPSDNDFEEEEEEDIHYDRTIDKNPDPSEDEDDEDAYDHIDVNFSFKDPCSDDFMDVRNFIQKNLLLGAGKNINFNDLSEYICNQPEVGAMVKIDEEPDVFAFMSIINLYDTKNNCMKELYSYLMEKCPKDLKDQFSKICNHKKTGILFNERMINFPQQLIPNLFTTIKEDIEWVNTNKEIQNKELFQFDYILCICPCYIIDNNKKNNKEQLLFGHYEDEIIQKYSIIQFSFHVPQIIDQELSDTLPQARKILIFPYNKINTIIQETTDLLTE